ncbi:MAG: hypothetical protein Q8736_02800, partial [Sweet potato little leaf phytoplasma]|nr:hypothetical protein [Sweet potato little leaf phytoplasma]
GQASFKSNKKPDSRKQNLQENPMFARTDFKIPKSQILRSKQQPANHTPNSRPSICKEATKTPETGTTKTEPRKKLGIRTEFSAKPKPQIREREEQRFSF